tara:strand:- start:667 stop:789 length:123 start_codon:yes stop_codon:yes gene_type:complete
MDSNHANRIQTRTANRNVCGPKEFGKNKPPAGLPAVRVVV